MTETPESHVITDVPPTPAPKQSRFHNPFAKTSETESETTEETPKRKLRAPRGAVTAGLLLLAAGVGAALGSKLSKDETDVDVDTESTDTESTDN